MFSLNSRALDTGGPKSFSSCCGQMGVVDTEQGSPLFHSIVCGWTFRSAPRLLLATGVSQRNDHTTVRLLVVIVTGWAHEQHLDKCGRHRPLSSLLTRVQATQKSRERLSSVNAISLTKIQKVEEIWHHHCIIWSNPQKCLINRALACHVLHEQFGAIYNNLAFVSCFI